MQLDRREFMALTGAALVLPSIARAGSSVGFDPPIGVCRGLGDVAAAAAGGAAYLECRTGDLGVDADAADAARIAEAVRAAPIPVLAANSFLPGSLKCVGPDADHAAVLAHAGRVFERAERLGLEKIVFGSSSARRLPNGCHREEAELQFTALLARMGDLAAPHGITVCVEPLQASECNWLNTVRQARRIVAAVQHEHVGITADIFHMLRGDEGPESIRDAGGLIRHVHVAENEGRDAPGVHGEDFGPYLRALAEIGFAGRISIECRWDDFGAQLPAARAALHAQVVAAR